jgi:hypothetical protein
MKRKSHLGYIETNGDNIKIYLKELGCQGMK